MRLSPETGSKQVTVR